MEFVTNVSNDTYSEQFVFPEDIIPTTNLIGR